VLLNKYCLPCGWRLAAEIAGFLEIYNLRRLHETQNKPTPEVVDLLRDLAKVRLEAFHLWPLVAQDEARSNVTCDNGNSHIRHEKAQNFTDFPTRGSGNISDMR
jgi:hypothetical protein